MSGWDNVDVPAQQDALARVEMEVWLRGAPHGPFDAFRDLIGRAIDDRLSYFDLSILEVGCGAGYYADVCRQIADWNEIVTYTGCDSSWPMVRYAREKHPETAFSCCDQRAMSWPDGKFDMVVSGSCLLHIPPAEWPIALAEARRVSRCWVILHRTPVLAGAEWEHVTKSAYGVEIEEWHVPKNALIAMTTAARLIPVQGRIWSDVGRAWQESTLYRLDA